MADSSFSPHRVFIVNGQPILIQGDSRLNSVNSISADILQQALQDTNPSENIAVIDSSCGNFLPNKQEVSMDETNDDNKEYVAILGDQDNDDSPTIHLTLEQAAELGLHFEVENSEQSSLNPTATVENVATSTSFVISNNQNKILFGDSSSHNSIAQITGRSKLENGNNYIQQSNHLSTQSQISDEQSQQVTLIPQFINGTMTYTMQLPNQPNNEYLQIKESPFPLQSSEQCSIMSTTPTVCASDFSLANLSTSMMSLIQPTLTTSQVGLLSTNCIEPIMSTGIQSRINVSSENPPKLTYTLPNSLPIDSTSADIAKTDSTLSYQHTLPQVIDSGKKTKILPNGNLKQKSVLKTIALSNSNILNNTTTQLNSVKTSNPPLQELTETSLNSTIIEESQGKEMGRPRLIPQQKISEIKFLKANKSTSRTNDAVLPHSAPTNISAKTEETNSTGKVQKTIVASKVIDSVPQEVSAAFSRIPVKSDFKKPLGSNENPIQLVQQGQTFHSMQTLTPEQLKKIMTVLQQRHIDTASPSKNVLYDAETNTRIIYRVVCPEELYLRKKNDDNVPLKRRGRPKRVRLMNNQTNGSIEGEGTGEEEQPRKKSTFSRTRSGRLSRPPKHMVRDYKRIMKLDGEESDGAYSDYHSDHEEEPGASCNLLPGLSMKQKRNISAQFHCPTCGKIYLGFARMSRHFDKYPDHGSSDYLQMLRNSNPDVIEHRNIEFNGSGNGLWRGGVKIGRRRGRTRVRGGYPAGFSVDKCNKLKEALDSCERQEVIAVAGPTVARLLTTWELLLLRIEAIRKESRVAALYEELKQLLKKIQQMASKMFKPLDNQLIQTDKGFTVEVEDELMSKVLEVPCGIYQVSDLELCPTQPKIGSTPKKRPKEDDKLNSSNNKTVFDYKQESPEESLILEVSDYIASDSDEEYQEKSTEKRNKFTEDDDDGQVLSALNMMDKNLSAPRKEENRVTESFLLPNEEMMCDPDERDLDSVDEIVSERLQNLTGNQHQDLCKSDVDELMKGFSVLDHRIVTDSVRNRSDLEPPDDLMEGFSITARRSHIVSASTEDLIKSLEHFGSELNHSEERTAFQPSTIDRENFTRVSNVDLDFEVLSREFHSSHR